MGTICSPENEKKAQLFHAHFQAPLKQLF
jgi:hypothetical protein